jgi:BirA family biotin operon repressor/biotin-[acetyl-CoA-carboxylase] ligase
LTFSIVLRPPPPVARWPALTLVAAHAVADAIGDGATIKEPNDVLVAGRKVAGVLAEASEGRVVLGIGLNVNQRRDQLPDDARVAPTSLFAVDAVERDRAALLADLVLELERVTKLWETGGLDAIYEELGSRDFLRSRRVRVDGVEGTATGIGRDGRLEIAVNGDRRHVESDDVEFVR